MIDFKKALKITERVIFIIFIVSVIFNFLTFKYYFKFSRVNGFADFLFCLLMWVKLTAPAVLALALFYGSKNARNISKYLYPLISALLLIFSGYYFKLEHEAITELEQLYIRLNTLFPNAFTDFLYVFECVLLFTLSTLLLLFDEKKAEDFKSFKYFPLFLLVCYPLNLTENVIKYFSPQVKSFFAYSNFSVWYFLTLLAVGLITYFTYKHLSKKDRTYQDKFLAALTVCLLIQFLSRMSVGIADGYNTKHTLIELAPLYICNIGTFVVAFAIFFRLKILYKISFFVHGAGAVSVFLYTGRPELSNWGTVFSYNYMSFAVTHMLLFMLCFLPYFLRYFEFKTKDIYVCFCYYMVTLSIAVIFSALVSSQTFFYGEGLEYVFEPNYSFTQISPFAVPLPQINFTLFNYRFNLIYLILLYFDYILIFITQYSLIKSAEVWIPKINEKRNVKS